MSLSFNYPEVGSRQILQIGGTQWRTEGGEGLGCSTLPPPEIPKALQNCGNSTRFVKTVKN